MDKPLAQPQDTPSELHKFPLFYEHVNDNRPDQRSSKPTTRK